MDTTSDSLITTIEDGRKLFEERYPELSNRAECYFRDLAGDAKQEAIATTMFFTWEDFTRLIERALATDTLLTTTFCFACRRTRSGRTVNAVRYSGGKELFNHSKRHNLDMDAFVHDRVSVLDAVTFKLDTQTWLDTLPEFQRELAVAMANGGTTKEIAERHHVTAPAISMRRAQLKTSYEKFIL